MALFTHGTVRTHPYMWPFIWLCYQWRTGHYARKSAKNSKWPDGHHWAYFHMKFHILAKICPFIWADIIEFYDPSLIVEHIRCILLWKYYKTAAQLNFAEQFGNCGPMRPRSLESHWDGYFSNYQQRSREIMHFFRVRLTAGLRILGAYPRNHLVFWQNLNHLPFARFSLLIEQKHFWVHRLTSGTV